MYAGYLPLSLFLFWSLPSHRAQLVVNVKNKGGEVYRENIEANTTQDTVRLEFRLADGTFVTQFIDGRNEIQIFKIIILPEEEYRQTQVQTMCFVLRFAKNEFISSDAMSKLRQKNPSAVRHPEEDQPDDMFSMDLLLNVAASHVISPYIAGLCDAAKDMTYTRDSDLKLIAQILNRDYGILQSIAKSVSTTAIPGCPSIHELWRPCVCHTNICIGWYPCGLKYCRGKDSANRVVNYRCGIKTCSKCRRFEFFVHRKQFCVWDEPEFQMNSSMLNNANSDVHSPRVEDQTSQNRTNSSVDINNARPNNGAIVGGVQVKIDGGELPAGRPVIMEQKLPDIEKFSNNISKNLVQKDAKSDLDDDEDVPNE